MGTPACVRIAYYTLCDFVHRYGEMDKPRFGEVRMRAWVNSGSRKVGLNTLWAVSSLSPRLGSRTPRKQIPGYRSLPRSGSSSKIYSQGGIQGHREIYRTR